jgi:hypothetical protein
VRRSTSADDVVAAGPSDLLGPALLLEPDPEFAGTVIADFTLANGRLVGLEFLRASACLPADLLASAQRIDDEHLARRVEARNYPITRPACGGEGREARCRPLTSDCRSSQRRCVSLG